MNALAQFHFLRPVVLLALLGIPLLLWLARRRHATPGAWRRAIDPHLLPHLIAAGSTPRGTTNAVLLCVAYALGVLALAGPSWRQVEQPLWQVRQPLVIAVDLSSATLAADIAPSRLAQLHARLSSLLSRPTSGQVGLVAFAGDAFTVAPLTDDVANIALFVDDLHPDVMPVDGQATDRPIEWSRQLMERAGFSGGRIVVITDHADAAALRAAATARAAGFEVSALGLGTASGADVHTGGGDVVHVALDASSLRALAATGGGAYAALASDGSDASLFAVDAGTGARRGREGGRVWQDEGFRLVPLMMLPLLWLLARRTAPALLVLCLVMPFSTRAADLWLRPDQREHAQIEQGVQAYRRGQFDAAAAHFSGADSADAHYDRGNALAKAGKLQEAVSAYDAALKRAPHMSDAQANRNAVLAELRRKPPSGGKNGGQSGASKPKPCAPGDANCKSDRPDPAPSSGGAAQPASKPAQSAPPKPGDAAQQARADAAQRERMQQALRAQTTRPGAAQQTVKPKPALTSAQRERKLANDAALQRVPDAPGSLLREKFRIEYERRQQGGHP